MDLLGCDWRGGAGSWWCGWWWWWGVVPEAEACGDVGCLGGCALGIPKARANKLADAIAVKAVEGNLWITARQHTLGHRAIARRGRGDQGPAYAGSDGTGGGAALPPSAGGDQRQTGGGDEDERRGRKRPASFAFDAGVISDLVWEGQPGPTSWQPLSHEQVTLVGSVLFYSIESGTHGPGLGERPLHYPGAHAASPTARQPSKTPHTCCCTASPTPCENTQHLPTSLATFLRLPPAYHQPPRLPTSPHAAACYDTPPTPRGGPGGTLP